MCKTKLDDYIGQHFNEWTIIGIERGKYPSGKNYSKFLCRCSCGIEQLCQTTDIKTNKSKKCLKCKYRESQNRYNNLEGLTFNKWTVLKLHERKNIEKDGYRRLIWECRCECSRIGYVQSSNLTQNLSKSCGLCGESKELAYRLFKKLEHSRGNRKLELDSSIDGLYLISLFESQNGKCAISGVEISLSTGWNIKCTASIDRRDNNKGYIKDNIQWVHKDINKMKHAYTQEYFVNMCKQVAKNNEEL